MALTEYQNRILEYAVACLGTGAERALDFGCGDGALAKAFKERAIARDVVAVDVRAPDVSEVPIVVYSGRLPFEDRAFDLVYAIDVLHHCDDPRESLRDLLRCTSRRIFLKDHTYGALPGKLALAALDLRRNLPRGISSPFHYQHGWEWESLIEDAGFRRIARIHPAVCNRGLLGRLTNELQFVSVWQRT